MNFEDKEPVWKVLSMLFKQHPWHGVPIGPNMPEQVTTFIEIVPTDTVKFELDKITGHLKVDRPQKFSNICPTLYGFIPQTYCADRVAQECTEKTGRKGIAGDGDPLDICVLTEKEISHGDILVQAVPIGGLRVLDGSEADDKIIAVMKDDATYGAWRDIKDCPKLLTERLAHYFMTYKDPPGQSHRQCEVVEIYGREDAYRVIQKSFEDYKAAYGNLENLLAEALKKS